MFSSYEQLSAATKANYESRLAIISKLNQKALSITEKIIDINVKATKENFSSCTKEASELFSAKDPHEYFTLMQAYAQSNFDKSLAYGRNMAGITAGTREDISEVTETNLAEAKRLANSLLNEVFKSAPAGSENVIALTKSTLDYANAGYAQMAKVVNFK